jgi:hypothetical protein
MKSDAGWIVWAAGLACDAGLVGAELESCATGAAEAASALTTSPAAPSAAPLKKSRRPTPMFGSELSFESGTGTPRRLTMISREFRVPEPVSSHENTKIRNRQYFS